MSQLDLPYSRFLLLTYPIIIPHLKIDSLEVLIHSLHMIGASILRVSEGQSDSLMVWQVCRASWRRFTKLCIINSVFIYLIYFKIADLIVSWQTASLKDSKYNQRCISLNVTSFPLFPIGCWLYKVASQTPKSFSSEALYVQVSWR